jgi:monofunctional biosynthetic peptidoglycan transglycosylase
MSGDFSARRGEPPPRFDEDDRGGLLDEGRPRSVFRTVLRLLIVLALLPFGLTLVYLVVPPPSTLMMARWATLRPVQRDWVPLERISPALQRAVIGSEDARFCAHNGVDWGALRSVMEDAGEDGPARGASTITMQTAKNLFLWNGFGYVRKPIEIVLAHWLDLVWPKRRVLEVYLNIAEWGPNGVFGAEAGARHGFGKAASALSGREAGLMAAALPNPVVRDTARPTRAQARRGSALAARGADTSCLAR